MLRLVEVRSDPQAEQIRSMKIGIVERVNVRAQAFAKGTRQFTLVMDGGDSFQMGLKRPKALGFNTALVCIRVIKIGNFAWSGSRGGVGLGNLLNQFRCPLVADVGEHGETLTLGRSAGISVRFIHAPLQNS
jgi:hypothetical protein